MRKNKQMSLEEHIETANDLAIALHHLERVCSRCREHFYKTSRLMKLLWKVDELFLEIKSILDDYYHALIDDATFKKHGHIYYNLDERYKTLQSKV